MRSEDLCNRISKEEPERGQELATFRSLALRVQNGSKTGSRRLRKMSLLGFGYQLDEVLVDME